MKRQDRNRRKFIIKFRNVKNCKSYGVEVKSTNEAARTGRKLLKDKKLDYLYLLKGETGGGSYEEKIYTVSLCLADRIVLD